MKFNKTNPLSDWGFEQEVYTKGEATEENGMVKMEDGQEGFINESAKNADRYNVVEPVADFTVTSDILATAEADKQFLVSGSAQNSFFTNDENMQPTEIESNSYAYDNTLQRKYDTNEELRYNGIHADDLKLYGEAESADGDGQSNQNNDTDGGTTNEPDDVPASDPEPDVNNDEPSVDE